MLIDWTTVVFQVVNFLLLIAVLKRFLYGPISRAMAKREADLTEIREEALRTRAEADAALETYRSQQLELESAVASRLQQAEIEAGQRRRELLARARAEAEELRLRWREALQQERQAFLDQLKKRSAGSVLAVSRRVLADLTEARLETALVRVLIGKLQTLPAADLERFTAAARSGPLQVRSGWEPDGELHRQLVAELTQACGTPVTLDWILDPELPLGIRISTDGLHLAWGTEDYLDELQRSVSALFDQQAAERIGAEGAEEEP